MMGTREEDGRQVRALAELPRSIAPPEELWSRIAAGLEPPAARRPRRPWALAAAVVLALFAGALIGRVLLPASPPVAQTADPAHRAGPDAAVPVAYITDPRYLQQRAVLLRDLKAQLAALPPDTQSKVVADLATIHQSMLDLQAALGRDPSNALLQELLVNTYQDEMHLLVSVHEASEAGQRM